MKAKELRVLLNHSRIWYVCKAYIWNFSCFQLIFAKFAQLFIAVVRPLKNILEIFWRFWWLWDPWKLLFCFSPRKSFENIKIWFFKGTFIRRILLMTLRLWRRLFHAWNILSWSILISKTDMMKKIILYWKILCGKLFERNSFWLSFKKFILRFW